MNRQTAIQTDRQTDSNNTHDLFLWWRLWKLNHTEVVFTIHMKMYIVLQINEETFQTLSVDNVFRGVTARGNKLFCSGANGSY